MNDKLIQQICVSVSLALSIAVIVLNILNEINAKDSAILLVIGLTTLSLKELKK